MGKKKKEVRDRACAERLLLRKKNGRETGLMIYLKSLQRSYLLAGGQWSQRAYTYTARIHHEDSRIQLDKGRISVPWSREKREVLLWALTSVTDVVRHRKIKTYPGARTHKPQ
ncbi:CDC42 small effector protein 1 isoform X5 [Hyla sarda]|uniref:CDC42 small effector protein 1 isoform X5 n=1 Tax=Hyla sarda TaxID=327740 RepID=UPI0024C32A4D|nr:CDC42 small effector protein 1 isoform X5 [Hyla sarda]